MDRFSPRPKAGAASSQPVAVRVEPQRVSAASERERRIVAAPRPRAGVLELDRATGHQQGSAVDVVRQPTQISIQSRGSAALNQVLDFQNVDDVHDRETVASRIHAAAAKRRKKVVAVDRAASIGTVAGRELTPVSQTFTRPPPAADLSLSLLREPAPIVVREQQTLTPDEEHSRPLVAATSKLVGVVAHAQAGRSLAFIVGRSDSSGAERDRLFGIERARWRASALLAIVLGLFGGFALRSIVSMKPWSAAATVAVDGAAFEEGIPARSVIEHPASQPLTVASPAPVSEPAAQPAVSAPLATTRPSAAPSSSLKRNPLPTGSRKAPLDMPTETPRSAVASNSGLPAAPPAVDTTPLQVYRGF
jgi:hypothetical protein